MFTIKKYIIYAIILLYTKYKSQFCRIGHLNFKRVYSFRKSINMLMCYNGLFLDSCKLFKMRVICWWGRSLRTALFRYSVYCTSRMTQLSGFIKVVTETPLSFVTCYSANATTLGIIMKLKFTPNSAHYNSFS